MRRAAPRSAAVLAPTLALALACCGRPVGDDGRRPARLPRPNGAWSAREALDGPMAAYGPKDSPEGVLTVTCLLRPRRELVVTLLTTPPNQATSGELVVRAGRRTFHAPLTARAEGSAEAHLAASADLISALTAAPFLQFEALATPSAGVDTGRPDAALKRVLAMCR